MHKAKLRCLVATSASDGERIEFLSFNAAGSQLGMNPKSIYMAIYQRRPIKGWYFRRIYEQGK